MSVQKKTEINKGENASSNNIWGAFALCGLSKTCTNKFAVKIMMKFHENLMRGSEVN
jgi:hypothetical protein